MKRLLTPVSIIAFSFLLASGNCRKDKQPPPDNPYGLPNATQTGENIFACRVNGQNWISQKGIYYLQGTFNNKNTVGIRGFDSVLMGLSVNNYSFFNNSYSFNDTIHSFAIFQVDNSCLVNPSGGYGGVTQIKSNQGIVAFTKVDSVSKILSGIFWFNILTDYCDTIKITDGRFDIKYY